MASVQGPVALAEGLNAAEVSASATADQLAQPTLFLSSQFHHNLVSASSNLPPPLLSLAPYSVEKRATPFLSAAAPLLRRDCLWVAA